MKLTVKANIAHGVKIDNVSSIRQKDILDVDCTDRVTVAAAYRCIEEDNRDLKIRDATAVRRDWK